jgi:hypothetical protein
MTRNFPFPADEVRKRWTYLPGERAGARLADMDREESAAAYRMLSSGLSEIAFAKACAIIALEDVLDRHEGHTRGRHAGDYWLALFGDPDGDGPWAWRFEGHHVSVNTTLLADEVCAHTPLFLGANPARVERDGVVVSAPLQEEEELGFRLVQSLDRHERAAALISGEAPDDIVTRDAPRVDPTLQPEGVRLGDLGGDAAALGRRLVDLYVGRAPHPHPPPDPEEIRFAWAGPTEPGGPHYYRLQGPRFLAELDNTQNGANHVHTVWRDPEGDFGDDMLAEHYRTHHQR